MKKVAIIGSGYTGLSCAKKLVDSNCNVTIFEKTEDIGGIAKCVDCYDVRLEKHYRHILKSDKYVIELLKEFNLQEKLLWNETQMGYFSKERSI